MTQAMTLKNRAGFGLAMAILVMFILTGALAAGFTMLSGERATDDATLQGQAATALAETGLQQGLRNRTGLGLSAVPPAGVESVRVTLTGGYADIVTTKMRNAVGTTVPALYVVRSRGVNQRTGVVGAGNSVAMATAFATFQDMTFTVQSSMTGINGIDKAGNSGIISGVDQCSVANGGTGNTLPAVAVPADPGFTGHTGPLEGNPKVDSIGDNAQEAAMRSRSTGTPSSTTTPLRRTSTSRPRARGSRRRRGLTTTPSRGRSSSSATDPMPPRCSRSPSPAVAC